MLRFRLHGYEPVPIIGVTAHRVRGEDQMTITRQFNAGLVLSAFDGEVSDVKVLVALVSDHIPA